jgi:hypothetical protein
VIAACGQTRETRSVSDLTRYQACRLEIDESTKSAYRDLLTEQIEGGLTHQGVCEMTPSGDLVLRIKPRVRAMGIQTEKGGPHAEANVEVTVVDGATGKEVGAFSTRVDSTDDTVQTLRGMNDEKALRRAAEEIVTFVRSKRGGGRSVAKRGPSGSWSPALETHAAPPASVPPPSATGPAVSAGATAQAAVPPPRGCSLQCIVPHHGAISHEDEVRLTSELGATLTELHACLGDTAGVNVLTLRFNSQSKLVSVGIDVGDQEREERPCMETVRTRVPAATMPGPTTVRCNERCGR